MLRLTLRNLRANLSRLVATAIAIATGTAFLAAGLMITQSLSDTVAGNADLQYRNVDVAVTPQASDDDFYATLNVDDLETVRSTAGVTAAAGELQAESAVLDSDGDPVRSRTVARSWIDNEQLNPVTITEGRAPTEDGEIAVDIETAADGDLTVGQDVSIATPNGELPVTIVGLSGFGAATSVDSGGTIYLPAHTALEALTGGSPAWDGILVISESPEQVIRSLQSSLTGSPTIQTGDNFREEQSSDAEAFVSVLSPVLTGFALLALFVAGFVIYNTFTVVVAQRRRELALVRAVGATPGQVRRSLLGEGVLLGIGASAIGLLLGIAIARAIEAILDRFDVRLPGAGISISPRVILLTLLAGSIVTLVSILIPAYRAGSSRPVEAMRESEVDDSGTSKVRMVIGGIFLLLGIGLLFAHALASAQWFYIGPGALLLFIGVVVGGPLLARMYGKLMKIGFSPTLTGRLAADNMVRNPKRTATTANALVIGLFLVTLVTVAGTAVRDWIQGEVADLSDSDYLVIGESPLPDDLLADIAAINGVESSAAVRTASVESITGQTSQISGTDIQALSTTAGFTPKSGSIDDVIAGEGAAVSDFTEFFGQVEETDPPDAAPTSQPPGSQVPTTDETEGPPVDIGEAATDAGIGDVVVILDPDGEPVEMPILATFEPKLDTIFLTTVVSDELFERLAGPQPVTQVYIRTDANQVEEVGTELDNAVKGFSGIAVLPGNFIGQTVGQVIDFLIAAVNGLLGLSVLIALIGIVNTMNLSIHERRRELGMVRALGMTSSQVRLMVRVEAILIGLLGTMIGVGSGVLVGWAAVQGLTDTSIPLAWDRVGLIFAAGLVVSLLACLLPARTAVKVPMLEAMAAT